MTTGQATRPYPLDNDSTRAAAHHDYLAEVLDPVSTRRLAGLGDWAGATCLEVGAGGGSIARWLAERVGPTGAVVASDIKPQYIPAHPQLRVVAHDLNGAVPLPAGPYDLIHARLVLGHLPRRREILHELIGLLAPGGVILIEDWQACLSTEMVIAAPGPAAADLYQLYQETVGRHVFAAHGTDRLWARQIHPAMVGAGLTDVATTVATGYWTGGGSGCRLIAGTVVQLRDKLLAAGMTPEQLDQLQPVLADPALVLHGHPLYSTSGRAAANR